MHTKMGCSTVAPSDTECKISDFSVRQSLICCTLALTAMSKHTHIKHLLCFCVNLLCCTLIPQLHTHTHRHVKALSQFCCTLTLTVMSKHSLNFVAHSHCNLLHTHTIICCTPTLHSVAHSYFILLHTHTHRHIEAALQQE